MSKGNGKSSKKLCFAYIAAFVVIITVIILVLAFTVLRVKSPKVRFNAMAVESFSSSNSNNNNSSSIRMRLLTQVAIKNTNFGYFRYHKSTLTIFYKGVPLGEAAIPRGRTKALKTERFNVPVDLGSDRLSAEIGRSFGNDVNSGVLELSSQASLKGKVHLLRVIKRKKTGNMNCNWNVNLATRVVENLRCK